ncbi:hypothetical protein NQ317_013427 [Molorchus minor]|uniref:Dynein regulatory complex subunit 2 n=1 Tax=Molorchus minor TaxID=1323400 RepID=A0ABQ9JRS8_9CUCU|nr:hypothetical protein NQ317_013427 [Molorchus minor]
MGGKKKSLANKLAKMTDEERARYLQHKAEMEEEARRRKEQLIATFLKRKIKREEMFSRLNLAKINQHWHQILRKSKCQEMKENVLHMKNWIERVLEYKNRTISKLMEELEEAEEQYSNNFQSHSIYIDNIIGKIITIFHYHIIISLIQENQHQCIENMQQEYSEDVNRLLKFTSVEMETLIKNAKNEEQYLQSVLYGQENGGNEELKSKYEYYKQKEYETEMNVS